MNQKFVQLSKYVWSPGHVHPTTFYILLSLKIILTGVICFMFHAVVIDGKAIQDNIIVQMQRDGNLFVKKIKNNEINLHVEFSWVNDYASAINNSCVPLASSVNMIRYCGYTFAIYNTIMMHFMLAGKLPVTITSIVPLVLSLIGGSIPSTHIIFFSMIEFMQVLIGFAIISVGFFNLIHSKRSYEENSRSLID